MICPSCGVSAPAEARFCPSCGHALDAPGDERRVVTVVFGDIVGFTAFSETRDPEHVKNVIDRCFERLVADIASYGGRVDKIVGDAIVALFGAPVAHEDDAERAVRAALQMQRTMDSLASEVDAPVQMRIGINTGEVLVGALRAGGDYTAMGDVVNTASRLQSAAPAGSVLAGPETWLATNDAIRYEALGSIKARGRGELVEAWRAIEATAPPGRRRRRARTPLVGRDAELGVLRLALAATIANRRPHLALLVGEAGMGKSRLAEEVAATAAAEHGARVLEGRSVPYGEANVWWPVAEVIRQACDIGPDDAADAARTKARIAVGDALDRVPADPEVERVTEGLLYLMGHTTALSDVDHSRAKSEVGRAVRSFLEGLTRAQPVVLVLSDLQWADDLVLEMIDRLEKGDRLPLIVIGTARPELAERWGPKPGRHNLVVLHLDPLEPAAATRLLATLLEREPDADLRDALLERSGGNPFFLEELAALLTESRLLDAPDGAHVDRLPATLRGLVAARLDALPTAERDLLEDAAVLGRRGPVAALEALAEGRGNPDCGDALRGLSNKDLLVVDGAQCWFKSDVVREVAYGTLTKAGRARRHALLARWLASRASRIEREDEHLEELARHYAAAAELVREIGPVEGAGSEIVDEALDAIERAADRADERENHLVASRLYGQALRLADGGPRRRHFLIGRARAWVAMGRGAAARTDLDEVVPEAEATGDKVALARALTVLGEVQRHESAYTASLETLERAIRLWQELGDRRGESAALRRQGMTSLFAGDLTAAEKAVVAALQAFLEIGARRGEAWALQNLAWIAFIRGQTDEADERLESAAEVFSEIGDWGGLGWTLGLQAWVRFHQGRTAEAERLALQIHDEAVERGDRWGQAMLGILLASIRLWQGRTRESVDRARTAARIFTEIGNSYGQGQALPILLRGLMALGDIDEARAVLSEALDLAARSEGTQAKALIAFAPVALAVQTGETEDAVEHLRQVAGGVPTSRAVGEREWETLRALVEVQMGRPAEAIAVIEALRAAWGEDQANGFVVAVSALAYAASGRTDQVEAMLAALDGAPGVTYSDRVTALVAAGCSAAAAGSADIARERLTAAVQIADGTEDRLTQTIARLGRARGLAALGAPDAAEASTDAEARWTALCVSGAGWDRAFSLAAGLVSAGS